MVILRGYTTGKVVGMSGFSLSFKSDEVRRIVDAFESRYGKPSRVEEKDFLTKAGARFPNTEWRWEFPDSTITIHNTQVGLETLSPSCPCALRQRNFGSGLSNGNAERGRACSEATWALGELGRDE